MRERKKKVWLYYLISGLLISVIFIITVEMTTRLTSFFSGRGFSLSLDELDPLDKGIRDIYVWHPFTGFIFRPGKIIIGSHPNQKERSEVRIDRDGFLSREEELSLEKPPGEIRIAAVGASTTANVHLNYDDNWPAHLERIVQQSFPDRKVRVINAGIPGYDTAQSIGNLSLRVMPYKPDIVIIYHGYNDLKALSKDVEFKPDYSHIHTVPYGYRKEPPAYTLLLNNSMFYVRARNKYRERIARKMEIDRLRGTNLINEIPAQAGETFEQHIRAMAAVARGGGAQVVLSSFATLHNLQLDYADQEVLKALTPRQAEELFYLLKFTPGLTLEAIIQGLADNNVILERVAADLNTGWVDNAGLVPHEDRFFVDRVHFSRDGAELLGGNFAPEVIRLLKNEGAVPRAEAGS